MMFDVCLVGHITKDLVRTADSEIEMPGGTAYYTAMTASLKVERSGAFRGSEEDVRDFSDAVGHRLPKISPDVGR